MYKPCKLRNGRSLYECVLMDINTQRDFADVTGSMPVSNADVLGRSLRRVIAWAKWNSAPVVSSVESRRPMELSDSGHPIACCDGSNGQEKLPYTMLENRTRIEFDNTFCVETDLFKKYQQVIFRKRGDDLLENPKADRFLTQLPVHEYILFGTGLETSIKSAALGLLARGKVVTIITDACGVWNEGMADLTLRQLAAKGARTVTVDELLCRQLVRRNPEEIARRRSPRRVHVSRPHLLARRNGHVPTSQPVESTPSIHRTHHPLPTSPIKDRMPDPNGRISLADE